MKANFPVNTDDPMNGIFRYLVNNKLESTISAGQKDKGNLVVSDLIYQNSEKWFYTGNSLNEFIEFISTKKINLTLAQNNFYSSTQIKRIIVDMQTPFILYFDTISYSLMIDIDKNNYDSIIGQLIFSAVIVVIIIEIIICWVLIINTNENYKQQFLFFSEIPKRK